MSNSRIVDVDRLEAVAATGLLDTGAEGTFDELTALAARLLRAPFAFMTLVDAQRSFWKSRFGVPDDGPRQNLAEESFCQYVIASGEPLISGDVTADPMLAGNPSISSMGVRAWAGYPLTAPNGQPLGSFCVVDTVTRTWTDDDVEILRVLASSAGRELALREALADAAVAGRHTRLLADASNSMASTLDAEVAVGRLARLVVPELGDWSIVALVGADGVLADVGWAHTLESMAPVLDTFARERLEGIDGAGATYTALDTGEPIVLHADALDVGLEVMASEAARTAYRQLAPGVYGVWPLAFDGNVHGVLVIARDAGQPTFTPEEMQLATSIAERAGTVLDNASLFARQQRISAELEAVNVRLREASRHDRVVSRALQDAMLTRLPEPDHLHVTARYLTADGHDQVGGDWYDALLPPGGATTLMVGDVAGHDIAAATVMGQLRNLLRALAWDHHEETPAELITRLDRAMHELGVTTMTTLVLVRIEQTEVDARRGLRAVRWSTAGHPVPVLLDADGRAHLLDAVPDPPLGISPGFARHDHVAEILPGQTLLLYTDGLIERRDAGLEARQSLLLEVLDGAAGSGLDETLDALLVGMVGDDPDDDVALIAVRFHPEDEPRPAEAGPATA